MLRNNSKSLGNHVVSPEEKKKGCGGRDLQKRKVLTFKSGIKERVGDGKLMSTFIRQKSTKVRQYKIKVIRSQIKSVQQTNRNKRHKRERKKS